MRSMSQSAKPVFHKSESVKSTILRVLRKIGFEKRLEKPNPIEPDQPERDGDVVLFRFSCESDSAVRRATQNSQERELISRLGRNACEHLCGAATSWSPVSTAQSASASRSAMAAVARVRRWSVTALLADNILRLHSEETDSRHKIFALQPLLNMFPKFPA